MQRTRGRIWGKIDKMEDVQESPGQTFQGARPTSENCVRLLINKVVPGWSRLTMY